MAKLRQNYYNRKIRLIKSQILPYLFVVYVSGHKWKINGGVLCGIVENYKFFLREQDKIHSALLSPNEMQIRCKVFPAIPHLGVLLHNILK